MRKVTMAVALVAAAFAGGAAVNGPGLSWARSLLQAQPTDDRSDPFADLTPNPVELPPAPGDDPSEAPSRSVADEPAAADDDLTVADDADDESEADADAEPPDLESPAALALDDDPPAPEPAPQPEPITEAPRRDPQITRVSATSTPPSGPGAGPDAGAWAELHRRMRDLDVARYWIEGQPDGPVHFRCVIPLAGRRAVGQLFEARGDDALQAAEAALRRVALWRATETEAL